MGAELGLTTACQCDCPRAVISAGRNASVVGAQWKRVAVSSTIIDANFQR